MPELPPKILIATRNQGKVREITDLVTGLPVRFLSLADFPPLPEVVEDRTTFEGNALKKARAMARAFGLPTLADDSGLCVDALDGRPGVYSARYAGEEASDEEKCLRIISEMAQVPDHLRTARFVCVLALVFPDGEELTFTGSCEGRITRQPRGSLGFGYDPIFVHEDALLTFAEMDRETKNRVSHRGRALEAFFQHMRSCAEKNALSNEDGRSSG